MFNAPVRYTYNKSVLLVLGLGFLLQLALVSYTFPANELLSSKPLLHIDHAFHLYHANAAREFSNHGATRGYDPYFGAGIISGIEPTSSAKIPALLAALLPSAISVIIIYKWYVFLAAVFAPVFIGMAAFVLRLSAASIIAATILSVLIWWSSYLHWYYTAGMVSFIAGAFLSVLLSALVIRALEQERGLGTLIAGGVVGAATLLLHPLPGIGAAAVVLAYLLFSCKKLRVRRVVAVLLSIAIMTLLPSLFWLAPLMSSVGQISGELAAAPYQGVVDGLAILQEAAGVLGGHSFGAKLNPVLLIAGTCGLLMARDRQVAAKLWPFVGAGVFLTVFAHLGGLVPSIANIQPNRFAPVAYLMMIIPAAVGIELLVRRGAADVGQRRGLGFLAMIAMVAGGIAFVAFEMAREVLPGDHGRYGSAPPEVQGPGTATQTIINLLKEHTTNEARVLFENSLGRVHDGGHIVGYLAFSTHRYFIGGPYPFFTGSTGSWDGHVFGRSIQNTPNSEMLNLLSLYNVGWVIVHSQESKQYFDRIPEAQKIFDSAPVAFYRINRPFSYFLNGTGKIVSADYSGIELQNVEGPDVILKFKYLPGMTSDTETVIEPVFMNGFADPFIRLRNPAMHLKIYFNPT